MQILSNLRRKATTAAGWKPWFANSYEWLKACAVFLTGRRGGALSRVVIPLRLADDTQPVYLRCASSDFVTLHEVFMNREYGEVLLHAPERVRGILDLGANIGLASRWFLRCWPSAQVIAVEPDLGNAALLRRNLASAGNTSQFHRVVNAFVGGRARKAVLKTRGEGFANEGTLSDVMPSGSDSVLPVVTPAQLLEMTGVTIDLVKMDIEGSEKEVLEENLSWLQGCSTVVVELHDPLDEAWLTDIVRLRLPAWTVCAFETRHLGAHLAILKHTGKGGVNGPAPRQATI
jgi:FkbM family methyltransferase